MSEQKEIDERATVDVFVLCWNEEKMLTHFVNHYRDNFNVQNITVIDNQSTDDSVQIAKNLNCIVKTYDSKNELNDSHYLFLKKIYNKKTK
jgi:glycosyltransferase involved in cell wall biosynthesis